ncbi:MAG: glutamate racemase [Bacteroidetes bacterium]|nr:MAG: glutamate racemase [Bacteroidota bacterium]
MLGPIGIFDSGIGGLTVARAIHDLLPDESILYFGDTAHLPYGEKSPELIRRYSTRIALHLVESGCKAIVIACNSASSNALEAIKNAVGSSIPVIDMVSPMVTYISSKNPNARVGLIGTRATISSRVYEKGFADISDSISLLSRATPLLASAIEEGFYNDSIPQAVLEAYLSDDFFKEIDSIILGCTHYPLVSNEVNVLLSPNVEVIDSPSVIALELKSQLENQELLSKKSQSTEHHFQVSDLTENFRKSAQYFFGEDLKLEEVKL